jgi:hypothetical protein
MVQGPRYQCGVEPCKFAFRNDPAEGDAIMVTIEEMQNAEKFRFVAESGEPA